MRYLEEYVHKYVEHVLSQLPKKEVIYNQDLDQISKFEKIFKGRTCTEADIVNLMLNRNIVYLRMK